MSEIETRLVTEGDTTPVIYMTAHYEPSARVEVLIIEAPHRVTSLT